MIKMESHLGSIEISERYFLSLIGSALSDAFGVAGLSSAGRRGRRRLVLPVSAGRGLAALAVRAAPLPGVPGRAGAGKTVENIFPGAGKGVFDLGAEVFKLLGIEDIPHRLINAPEEVV